jgi:hypothetical protein
VARRYKLAGTKKVKRLPLEELKCDDMVMRRWESNEAELWEVPLNVSYEGYSLNVKQSCGKFP